MSQIPQTTVNTTPDLGLPGQLADQHSQRTAKLDTAFQAESSAAIPFGYFVKRGTNPRDAKLPTSVADKLFGIAVFGQSYSRSYQTGAGDLSSAGLLPGAHFDVLRTGTVWVLPTYTIALGDEVHVHVIADTSPTRTPGLVGNLLDAAKTIDISAFAQWESAGAAGTPVKLWIDMVNTALGVAGS